MKSRIFFIVFFIVFIFSLIFIFVRETGRNIEIEDTIFKIERGESLTSIADRLNKKGILRSKTTFLGYLLFLGKNENLQAGIYEITSGMSIVDIVDKISNGRVSFQNITFIEGWPLVNFATHLEESGLIEKDDFLQVSGLSKPQANLLEVDYIPAEDFKSNLWILRDLPEDASYEGYLFPDTYRIYDEDSKSIVKRMMLNLQSKISGQIKEDMKSSERNIHEIITMASLIEKEVFLFEDKAKISDILWRRLEIGMPLQVDATVNYITGRRGIDVTIEETKINSKYNTYQKTGLPEGPISNPGINSIKAALNPQSNDYWYYLSDPKTGKTIFSKNHSEHIKAKNKYLR